MADLVIYQLPDKTVLKKLNVDIKNVSTIWSIEKLDNSDDRFVILNIEGESKTIYVKKYDAYLCEAISDYDYSATTSYVTVEVDIEWRGISKCFNSNVEY
ncbi:hypothetical protein [Nostoc sp.]|uniref:hypothetical protein n=1 Tax=Nostoc sp. TaxID=1180 RepID=UPI002FFD3C43